LYYEGWDPSRTPQKLDLDEFVYLFVREAAVPELTQPEEAVQAAALVLRRHVTEGEYEDVLVSMPRDLRMLLE
jgi:uncharacterized protein (DUF2267 family)